MHASSKAQIEGLVLGVAFLEFRMKREDLKFFILVCEHQPLVNSFFSFNIPLQCKIAKDKRKLVNVQGFPPNSNRLITKPSHKSTTNLNVFPNVKTTWTIWKKYLDLIRRNQLKKTPRFELTGNNCFLTEINIAATCQTRTSVQHGVLFKFANCSSASDCQHI